MKKTIIAAAIATVIAAPAMADVSVSGVVEQTFTDTDSVTDTGLASGTDSGLTFKASEDLGNGLTAFAQISLDTDNQDSATRIGNSEKDSKVGIKGGFGTVVVGRMEDFTEGQVMSMMTLNGTANFEMSGNATRTNDAIAYVSPAINGLTVGIAGFLTSATNDEEIDARDAMIAYTNGPLTIKLSDEDQKGGAQTTAIAAAYKTGDIKVTALYADREKVTVAAMMEVSSADVDANIGAATFDYSDLGLRLDYTMGNNTITLARTELDLDSVNGTAVSWEPSVIGVEVTHKMSKRTSVYAGYNDVDTDINGIDDVDTTYFGMIHKF